MLLTRTRVSSCLGYGIEGRVKAACNLLLSQNISSGRPPGLFGLDIHRPECFIEHAAAARQRCVDLMSEVLASPGDARVVQLMDDMSDELCRTYDAAEACRNIHDDQEWKRAATRACIDLGAFISEVNHHPGIYASLSSAMANYNATAHSKHATGVSGVAGAAPGPDRTHSSTGTSCSGRGMGMQQPCEAHSGAGHPRLLSDEQLAAFCPETVMVGTKLKLDMEKAGIHMAPERQARMQELMNASSHFAARFNAALVDPKQLGSVSVPAAERNSGHGGWAQRLRALTHSSSSSSTSTSSTPGSRAAEASSTRRVPLDGSSVGAVLAHEPDGRVRQAVFEAAGRSPASNIVLLEQMLLTRSEMAGMVGCDSYSQYKAWGASLAQDPAAIHAFLMQLAQQVKPAADQEVKVLQGLKAGGSSAQTAHAVMPWDVDFLMAQARSAAGGASINRKLQEYTHLPVVLKGFTRIMEQLFGLTLAIAPAPDAESWAPGVLKCAALLDGCVIGTVYLDLCSRPGKYPSAVTFPIRCGRQLSESEYQAPIMALLADFGHHGRGPVRLTMRELRTLVHELGHCCHNLLSRTKYQHLWGTRCAQDMVEVPSHLWEHFVSDPRTLSIMARHHLTDDPLPHDLRNQVSSLRNMFAGLELQQQVLLSLVDQAYHGPHALDIVQQGTGMAWEHVAKPLTSLPTVSGLRPEARVGHFTIYGGGYYSYLYARCLSTSIWTTLLAPDPLDKGAGDLLREQLLSPGGSREPWDILHALGTNNCYIQPFRNGWLPNARGLSL